MANQQSRVARKGQIYRFAVDGTEYAAFIWQAGVQFCGRVEGQPHVPQRTAPTAIKVRDNLQQWLTQQLAPVK